MTAVDRHWPTAVDLFSGCGGVTEGLKRARFKVVAAVDNDPIAGKTYKANHPGVHFYPRDIRDVDPASMAKDLKGVELDLLAVCAPCQPFSRQNRKREWDRRSALILESLRFIGALRPRGVFFENVPGLSGSEVLGRLVIGLAKLGYEITPDRQVNAADYGVPQRRERFVALAFPFGSPLSLPEPMTDLVDRPTVRTALAGLDQGGDPNDPLHVAPMHRMIVVQRLQNIPHDGGSRSALPDHLVLKCHRNHSGHRDVYGRMRWDDVAPTMTTGCTNVTRGRFAHPSADRAITLREAARLQTFPDPYKFKGTRDQIATQIGNAVPVAMMTAFGTYIRQQLR